MRLSVKVIAATAIAVLLVPAFNLFASEAAKPATSATPAAAAPAAKPATTTKTAAAPKASTASAASTQEITDAKASGKVWVNTSSGVYHKSGRYYGKTKAGKFMTEDEAKTAGYKAATKE